MYKRQAEHEPGEPAHEHELEGMLALDAEEQQVAGAHKRGLDVYKRQALGHSGDGAGGLALDVRERRLSRRLVRERCV